jgi:hypothetical protein
LRANLKLPLKSEERRILQLRIEARQGEADSIDMPGFTRLTPPSLAAWYEGRLLVAAVIPDMIEGQADRVLVTRALNPSRPIKYRGFHILFRSNLRPASDRLLPAR